MRTSARTRYAGYRLIPYARNARTHSEAQVAQIAGSIREFGFTNPVLIGPEGGIIAGHDRVLASPNGLQTGVADRNARRFPFAAGLFRSPTERRSGSGCSGRPAIATRQNRAGSSRLTAEAAAIRQGGS